MARKAIPFKLREFLERQIVRGSRGYESVETVLGQVEEETLRDFLEWYENSVRDTLLTSVGETSQKGFDYLLKGAKQEEDSRDLSSLAASLKDEEPTTSLLDLIQGKPDES